MKQTRITLWLAVFPAIATLALVASTAAQTVVVGTGNPDIDVPAVQAAVDQGGDVVLKGHFSFDRPPTIVPALPDSPLATVLVSRAVAISGARDERDDDGEMTRIEAGTIPFYVEAPGASVSMQGLRFVRPKSAAVLVYAVSGLVIASCKIEGVEPLDGLSAGIAINTGGSFTEPGHPENISGTLLIVKNDIDDMAGGTTHDATLGVVIFYAGVPGAEVEAYVSGNRIRNFHERGVEIRGVGGRTFVEGNVIATGTIAGTNLLALNPIFVADPTTNLDSYLIAHNSVDVQWPTGSASGIAVRQSIARAIVVDNEVNMDAPEGTEFDFRSAGIEITGDSHDDVVLNNRIRGRARAALAVHWIFLVPPVLPLPANTAFVLNRFDHFEASLADVFVGDCVTNNCVTNTLIVGQGMVEDHGVGTVIVPVPNFGRKHEEGGDENRNHTGGEPREK